MPVKTTAAAVTQASPSLPTPSDWADGGRFSLGLAAFRKAQRTIPVAEETATAEAHTVSTHFSNLQKAVNAFGEEKWRGGFLWLTKTPLKDVYPEDKREAIEKEVKAYLDSKSIFRFFWRPYNLEKKSAWLASRYAAEMIDDIKSLLETSDKTVSVQSKSKLIGIPSLCGGCKSMLEKFNRPIFANIIKQLAALIGAVENQIGNIVAREKAASKKVETLPEKKPALGKKVLRRSASDPTRLGSSQTATPPAPVPTPSGPAEQQQNAPSTPKPTAPMKKRSGPSEQYAKKLFPIIRSLRSFDPSDDRERGAKHALRNSSSWREAQAKQKNSQTNSKKRKSSQGSTFATLIDRCGMRRSELTLPTIGRLSSHRPPALGGPIQTTRRCSILAAAAPAAPAASVAPRAPAAICIFPSF